MTSFEILSADTRHARRWAAGKMTWEEIRHRLERPERFAVTSARYREMNADERHGLKDVGGWLAGQSSSGSRKASDVTACGLVRLDADGAPKDWASVLMRRLDGLAWCAHTTASHTEDKPRARVVVPLTRPVDAEEYAYISRRLAERIGEDWWPDHSTFRHNQVAFWPAVPVDARYRFVEGEGRPVDVDRLLREAGDWRDASQWPFPPAGGGPSGRGVATDPRKRPGWVGAFCRAHDVPGAIGAFLPSVYVPGSSPDRRSYAKGSLRNGLVIYDNGLWAYSHHEISDPAAGRLCSSWDLVRIHLFGGLDARCKDSTPEHNRPSWDAMVALAGKDVPTLAALAGEEKEILSAFDLADDAPAADPPAKAGGDVEDWRASLSFDKAARPLGTFRNLAIILRCDPRLSGLSWHNELTHAIEIDRDRWHGAIDPSTRFRDVSEPLSDWHVSALRERIEGAWGRDWSAATVQEAIVLTARRAGRNPLVDRLDGLRWDGTPRLDSWLSDHAGAPRTEYVRQAGRKLLVAAAARARRPGCKWDHMLILQGRQGGGKSSLCRALALDDRWFSELRTVDPKVAAETVSGVWVAEMCELEAFDRAEISVLKAFVTVQSDRLRPAYGRNVEVRPRTCVVIGTTNDVEILRDTTGNRRFWPVRCADRIDVAGLRAVVEQLHAEAGEAWRAGEPLWLDGEAEIEAEAEQESHRQTDPWEDRIAAWLDHQVPEDWHDRLGDGQFGSERMVERTRVCVQEILDDCLRVPAGQQHGGMRRRVGSIMRSLPEWSGPDGTPRTLWFGARYGSQKGWVRATTS